MPHSTLYDHLLHPSPITGYYQTLTHSASIDLIGKKPGHFTSLDTETIDGVPFMITACDSQGKVSSWSATSINPKTRLTSWSDRTLHQVKAYCQSFDSVVFHNSKYDIPALARLDILYKKHFHTFHDTLAASHVCNSIESHGLKDLSVKYLEFPDDDESILKEAVKHLRAKYRHNPKYTLGDSVGSDYWLPFVERDSSCLTYACNDAIRTSLLWHLYHSILTQEQLIPQYLRELILIPIVLQMESRGITILRQRHTTTYKDVLSKVSDLTKECQKLSNSPDLNLNSPKQLVSILYDDFSLPIIARSATGQPKTDAPTISTLQDTLERDPSHFKQTRKGIVKSRAYAFIESLLFLRKADTARKYLANYTEYGTPDRSYITLHPSFNPWGTNTTRFSCSEPNAQNIGKKSEEGDINLRSIFGPTHRRVWYSIDYNQLELRIMAQASGDPTLSRVLSDGLDMHQITADKFKIPRKQGKNINFAWQYGASDSKLSRMAGISADVFARGMKAAYPGVMDYMAQTIANARSSGHVHTLLGYRLCVERETPYKGTNYVIQGSAGDCCKNAMISASSILNSKHPVHGTPDAHMILTIHDEIVFDFPASTPFPQEIRDAIACAGDLFDCPTPTSLSIIRDNWGDPEELKDSSNEVPANTKRPRSIRKSPPSNPSVHSLPKPNRKGTSNRRSTRKGLPKSR